jgi:predicted Zn-dependent protease
MAAGRFEEAIPICEQLVKAVPGNPGLILNLGMAEQMAGHPAKAVPRFEAVLKTEPSNIPALTSLATAHMQLNQPRPAIVPLKKLVALQPANHDALGMLAGALMGVDQWDEAAAEYRKLTAAEPSDARAWYGLGKAYESLAESSFERLSKIDPESPYVAALIAGTRLQSRQFRSAFYFYRRAEEKMPGLRGVHAGLAQVYAETGHADWADTERKKEATLPPANCATASAECQFAQHRYLESARSAAVSHTPAATFWGVNAYNQLAFDAFAHLGTLPESVELHALKAQILHGHNQEVEASKEWQAALKLAPGNRRVEGELATSLFLARDYASAVPLVEMLLEKDSKSPDLNFMLGESLLRTDKPDEALPHLETALRGNPGMLSAHASLGLALSKLDRSAEVIPHLEKALELDDDGSLHYALARAYSQAGNTQRSQELMEKYQQMQKRNQTQKDELAKDTEIIAPAR